MNQLMEHEVVLQVVVGDTVASVNQGMTALLSGLEGVSVLGCAQELEKVFLLIRRVKPDILLLDLQAMNGHGQRLFKEIRSAQPELTLVVLSAFKMPEVREAYLKAGADFFFEKITQLDELVEMLATRVKEHRQANAKTNPTAIEPLKEIDSKS